VVTDILGQDYP